MKPLPRNTRKRLGTANRAARLIQRKTAEQAAHEFLRAAEAQARALDALEKKNRPLARGMQALANAREKTARSLRTASRMAGQTRKTIARLRRKTPREK